MDEYQVIMEREDTIRYRMVETIKASSAEDAELKMRRRLDQDEDYFNLEMTEVDSGEGTITFEVRKL